MIKKHWKLGVYIVVLLLASLCYSKKGLAQERPYVPEDLTIVNAVNELNQIPNCNLPCLWGLELGESTSTNLQNLAEDNLGEVFPSLEDFPYINMGSSFADTLPTSPVDRFPTGASFWFQNDQLVAVGIRFDYPAYGYIDYTPYLPKGILSIHGEPDEITIEFHPGDLTRYGITLRYHDLGLYARYDILVKDENVPINLETGFQICNTTTEIRLGRVWLQQANISYSYWMQYDLWDHITEGCA